jgi:hypothetical protein
MSNIKQFIDENDLDAEDIIDALDIDPAQFIDYPDEPTDFYDGDPKASELAEDFDAVDMLLDAKEDLEDEVQSLSEEVREAKRPQFADKAEKLASMTERWGDEDELMEKFDAEDDDEQWSVEDLVDKIELVEDIAQTETTTITDSSDGTDDDDGVERTDNGGVDLRQRTKFTN